MLTTFNDILGMISVDYRECLSPILSELSSLASKEASVSEALLKLWKHKAANTMPPQLLGSKVPSFPLTKEYEATQPALLGQIRAKNAVYLGEVLDLAITMKAEEVEFLGQRLNPELYSGPLMAAVTDQWERIIKPTSLVPATTQATPTVISGWVTNTGATQEYRRTLQDDVAYAGRIVFLQRESECRRIEKGSRKSSLKDQADVEMGEASSSTAAIGDEVRKHLMKLGFVKKGKATSTATGGKKTPSSKPRAGPSGRKTPKLLGKASQATQQRRKDKAKADLRAAATARRLAKGKSRAPGQTAATTPLAGHKRNNSNRSNASASGKVKKKSKRSSE
ncbi:hypothetical protein M0805_004467 [Coniferiporia weirii]|nr:hypothetical protein M0805_004467 [Coniferiporia weirii]